MSEQHPVDAERTRPPFVVALDGSAEPPVPPAGDVTADALTPAYSPAVYDTQEFRDQLAQVIAQLRGWQEDMDELRALVDAARRLEAFCLPRQRGTP
ncbi:hypothetical protein [Streptomyces olivoreticuli]|uniref:hypothetical protein n=1 Tax=Streptomyces olivoreticuli TaxID=68246 RepID=UPI000E269806|nr:hypothetical protein [Streptomyces olivoreticuli]